MLPWVGLHIIPLGEAFPCCNSDYNEALDDVSKNSLPEIWNSKPLRELRLRMMEDLPSSSCRKCYETEASGIRSMRQRANASYASHLPTALSTRPDGHVEKMDVKYFDIRFSNVCNFKCKTCGPHSSSRWMADLKKEGLRTEEPNVLSISKYSPNLWQQIESFIPGLEEIYFAGGEPLIMEEHYSILKILMNQKRHDVRLKYNTNLSNLSHKGYDVIEMWRDFKTVRVSASIDASGTKAEFIREGTKWEKILSNIIEINQRASHLRVSVNCTISVLNVLHIPDLHKELADGNYVASNDFHVNYAFEPTHFNIQTLPSVFKEKVREKYTAYIRSLDAKDPVIARLFSIIKFMCEKDISNQLPNLKNAVGDLDHFGRVFPELEGIF